LIFCSNTKEQKIKNSSPLYGNIKERLGARNKMAKKSKKVVYILQNGRALNKKEFCRYIEKKVFYSIRKFKLLEEKDKIAVACSGGKDSSVALAILAKFCKQRRRKIAALAIDEGITGYRDKLIKELKKFCKKLDIPLHIFSFKKEYGFTLDKIIKKVRKIDLTNCYVCSILKRWLLNKKAKELGFTKIVTGHNLDDEAETILLNQLKGNAALLAKLGPKVGVRKVKGFVQRVKPLYFLSAKEIILYAKLNNLPCSLQVCPLRGETLRVEIREWLYKMERKYPNVKNAIVNSFLEILPLLKKKYEKAKLQKCAKCKEPCNTKICKRCQLVEILEK